MRFDLKNKMIKNKRGQLAVFVILAIAIIFIVVILLLPQILDVLTPKPPEVRLQECIEDSVEPLIEPILDKGGTLNPELYYLHDGESFEYLCYTNLYYVTCTMQKPMLKQNIENEIESNAQLMVDKCINELKSNLEKQNYVLDIRGDGKLNVNFVPEKAYVSIDLDIAAKSEDGTTRSYSKFGGEIKTNAYRMIMVATSISNFEARYGESNPIDYMTLYEDIKVEKLKQMDGTTLYIITDRESGMKLNFAVRSLAWPPAYGF